MIRALPLLLVSAAAIPDVGAQQPSVIPDGYRVETVQTPEGRAFGVGGMSFAADGALFVSTREGQVWTLVGDQWQLFADGLHEPLGVYVDPKTRQVFCVQRGELTELIDEDRDGHADRFRTVCAAWGLTDNYHEYAYGLVRDADGYFYGTLNTSLSWPGWAGSDKWDVARVHDCKMGRAAEYRGWSFRISPTASSSRGRAGFAPRHRLAPPELLCTDNQGDCRDLLPSRDGARRLPRPPLIADRRPDYRGKDLNAIPVAHGELRREPAVGSRTVTSRTPRRADPRRWRPLRPVHRPAVLWGPDPLQRVPHRAGPCRRPLPRLRDQLHRPPPDRYARALRRDGSLWSVDRARLGFARPGASVCSASSGTVGDPVRAVLRRRGEGRVRTLDEPCGPTALRAWAYQVKRWRYKHYPGYGSLKLARPRRGGIGDDGRRRGPWPRPELKAACYELTVDVLAADGRALANRVAWGTLHVAP